MKRATRILEFSKALFIQPVAITWVVITGLIDITSWLSVGEDWTNNSKVLLMVVITLSISLIYIMIGSYQFYSNCNRTLLVRDVRIGEHYNKDTLVVILDRSHQVTVGDLLTMYVRQGNMEEPICLLEVDALTSERFIQSNVIESLTDVPLLEYLTNKKRLTELHARFGVKKGILGNSTIRYD